MVSPTLILSGPTMVTLHVHTHIHFVSEHLLPLGLVYVAMTRMYSENDGTKPVSCALEPFGTRLGVLDQE